MEVALLVGLNDMTTYCIFTLSYPNIKELDHFLSDFYAIWISLQKTILCPKLGFLNKNFIQLLPSL